MADWAPASWIARGDMVFSIRKASPLAIRMNFRTNGLP
jgi:hypothetical protein